MRISDWSSDVCSSDLFRFIANARDLGFPIEEIAKLLVLWSDRNRASAEVKKLALMHAEELDRKARTPEAMRRSLLDLAERCHGDERPEFPILDGVGCTGHEVTQNTRACRVKLFADA